MRIGLVQPLVGSIGGNDKVLESFFEIFKEHDIDLFTFSKVKKSLPDNVTVHVKVPVRIPLLGIYQKFLMPQHDYSKCDVIISTTGYPVKTDKRLIIYDQNNLANEFDGTVPEKYTSGLWKLYYLPFRKISRPRIIKNAIYVVNSKFSQRNLRDATGICDIGVVYPPVDFNEFYTLPKKPQICVVGRISPEKNLEKTVRILNRTNIKSVLFGNVTRPNIPYFEKLKSLAHDHVTILDNMSREKLLHLLSESKIIFTSSNETFGITTVEGIASGCIPIVPDNSAHPETVPDSALRYQTEDEAVETINRVMKDGIDNMEFLQSNIKRFSLECFNRSFTELL